MVDKITAYLVPSKNEVGSGFHTKISFYAVMMAIVIMTYIGIKYINSIDSDSQAWGKFALLQAVMGGAGFILCQSMYDTSILPRSFKKADPNLTFRAGLIFALVILIQIITQLTLSPTIPKLSISLTDNALYFIFASVCEEMFCRGFIIAITENMRLKQIGIGTSAIFFTAIHINYYSNFAILSGILLSGIVYAYFYIKFKNDITAVMIAHFMVNIIATSSFLVTFGG